MQLVRDPSVETFVLDEMRRVLTRGRDGVHVSELLALRKAYWNRVAPKPLTVEEVLYFTAGRGHEDIVHSLSQVERGGPVLSAEGIFYTPDFFTNFPIELKSRRGGLIPPDEDAAKYFEQYVEQLSFYCALAHRTQGWLWVLFLTALREQNRDLGYRRTKPDFRAYRLELTEADLEHYRAEASRRAALLKAAEEAKDYRSLPLCPQFMCYRRAAEKTAPARCLTCRRDFQTDWGLERHQESKTGKGHEGRKAGYKEKIEPVCKYFPECDPLNTAPPPDTGPRRQSKRAPLQPETAIQGLVAEFPSPALVIFQWGGGA